LGVGCLPVKHPTSESLRNFRQPVSVARESVRTRKNAPSRWRLRPASRLTSAEAGADRRAINLVRSVLGAPRTLGGLPSIVKASRRELVANCDLFFLHRANCGLPSVL